MTINVHVCFICYVLLHLTVLLLHVIIDNCEPNSGDRVRIAQSPCTTKIPVYIKGYNNKFNILSYSLCHTILIH